MGWLGRSWFGAVSCFYAVLAVFAGGLSTDTALRFLETGEWRKEWGFHEPTFWIGGGAWAGLVVFIQLYRIACSSQRKKDLSEKPLQRSLWSFQVGGQGKFLLVLLLVPAVGWVVGWMGRL